MENNLAEVAGDAIYGGVIDYCFLFDTSTQNHSSSFQSKSVLSRYSILVLIQMMRHSYRLILLVSASVLVK